MDFVEGLRWFSKWFTTILKNSESKKFFSSCKKAVFFWIFFLNSLENLVTRPQFISFWLNLKIIYVLMLIHSALAKTLIFEQKKKWIVIFELQKSMIHKIMDFYIVFFVFLGASMGTGAPRNTHKIRTQCGYEYGCKSPESLVTLVLITSCLL